MQEGSGVAPGASAEGSGDPGGQGFARLVGALGHDLRTPLNAILGYSEMLREDMAAQGLADAAADLDRIRDAARTLLGQIDAVVRLAKAQAGEASGAASPAATDWGEVWDRAQSRFESLGANRGVRVTGRADAAARSASCDASAGAVLEAAVEAGLEIAQDGAAVSIVLVPGTGEGVVTVEVRVTPCHLGDADLESIADAHRLGPPGRRGLAVKTLAALCRASGGSFAVERAAAGEVGLRAAMAAGRATPEPVSTSG